MIKQYMKYLLKFSFTILMQTSAFAFVCPTAHEIKNHNFSPWLPLYKEGEELASDKDVEQFKQDVTQFKVAHWNNMYLEAAHCFYEGNTMTDKIIFAQDAWRPKENSHWVWIKQKFFARCYSNNVNDCEFIS